MYKRLFATTSILVALAATTGLAQGQSYGRAISSVAIGADNNSTANTFLQPIDPALSGNGRNQTLDFGDVRHTRRHHTPAAPGKGHSMR